jgi:hypothetical protein
MKEEAYAIIKTEITGMANQVTNAHGNMQSMIEIARDSFWKLNYKPVIGETIL